MEIISFIPLSISFRTLIHLGQIIASKFFELNLKHSINEMYNPTGQFSLEKSKRNHAYCCSSYNYKRKQEIRIIKVF